MRALRPGAWAWLGLVGYVVLADSYLLYKSRISKRKSSHHVTMSEVFADAIEHPTNRWPIIGSWAIITFHLFKNFFPESMRRMDIVSFSAEQLYDTLFDPTLKKRGIL